jgi:hypothetical protein
LKVCWSNLYIANDADPARVRAKAREMGGLGRCLMFLSHSEAPLADPLCMKHSQAGHVNEGFECNNWHFTCQTCFANHVKVSLQTDAQHSDGVSCPACDCEATEDQVFDLIGNDRECFRTYMAQIMRKEKEAIQGIPGIQFQSRFSFLSIFVFHSC